MIKVTVKGQVYSLDNEHFPLAEAIELEAALGMLFGEWQRNLALGSARAAAGLAWLMLKRAGQDVPLADILSGKFALDTSDIDAEPEGEPAGPTLPAASPGASGNGSPPSPSITDSPPPMSVPSPSPSSTP